MPCEPCSPTIHPTTPDEARAALRGVALEIGRALARDLARQHHAAAQQSNQQETKAAA